MRIKRLFDIVVSFFLLVILSPVLASVAVAIRINSYGPIFYTQNRLGLNGLVFKLYKFRSMTDEIHNPSLQTKPGSMGITGVGKIMRRFKIDELPQLFNVLIGDMSIVGPRPCLESLRSSFNDDAQLRLLVKPGMTGLAQVSGNIYLDWPDRWRLDREYVENMSFWLDVKIIFRTVLILVLGEKKGLKRK